MNKGCDRPAAAAERRRSELNDAGWLAERYEHASAPDIATELDVDPQQVVGALHRHGIAIKSRRDRLRSQRPLLHDPQALAAAVEASSVTEVAASLGVSVVGVQVALARNGVQSAHRYNGIKNPRPSRSQLEHWWASEQTFKGVARRAGVSPPAIAVWLAEVGIFAKSEPAVSSKVLRHAIRRGDSLAAIAVEHRLCVNTVNVELHRHGLFTEHQRRHLQ